MKKYLLMLMAVCLSVVLAISAVASEEVSGGYASLFGDDVLSNAPESVIDAKELMSVAVRLHSSLNGNTLTSEYDLDTYYAYATNNGIFADGVFTAEDNIPTRAQVVSALYNAVNGKVDLTAKNEVLDMVDVNPDAAYHAAASAFMKAGIIAGYDEYGTFNPNNTVKRYELGIMVDRILNASERVSKEYIVYSSDEPFYLIDDFLHDLGARGWSTGASGWRIDYTGSTEIGTINRYANILRDYAVDDDMSTSRRIHTQTEGELVFETVYKVSSGDTLHFGFYDADGNEIAVTGWQNGFAYIADSSNRTSIKLADKKEPTQSPDVNNFNYYMSLLVRTRVVLDLDEGKYEVWMGSSYVGEADLEGKNLASVKIYTGIPEVTIVTINNTHLFKNYKVNDVFRLENQYEAPIGYEVSGNVTVERLTSNATNTGEVNTVKMVTAQGETTYAKRSFEKANGKVVMEAYILLEDGASSTTVENNAYFTVKCADVPVLTVKTAGNAWYAGATLLKNNVTSNVWQWIRIEADTNTQTAAIKINGKYVNNAVPFLVKVDGFDGLEFGVEEAETAGDVLWFDDIEVYETFDYDDYCPEPVPLDTGDYILNMSVCNLWRNGSHYGWDWIRPFAEIEPVLGYYDEGTPEAMDWEIKFLTEHGIKNYMTCWYPHSGGKPIKKPRMVDALHDGYFNAKYSDMMSFSLMFENSGYISDAQREDFINYTFPLWMEWYFSDPRYCRITEDGKDYIFLTIYQYLYFLDMACTDYELLTYNDNGDLYLKKEYEPTGSTPSSAVLAACEDAAALIDWMEQQIIAAGYADGLIAVFGGSAQTDAAYKTMANMGGDGIILYAWGKTAWDVEAQKTLATNHTAKAKAQGIDLLTLATPGFNDIGWTTLRPGYMTTDNFETMVNWHKSQMATNYSSSEDSWKSKLITFDTWNEYGEGHYLFPTVGEYKNEGYGGFGYLDVIAEVFGGVARGSEAAEANNTAPTAIQKARVGRLYPADNDHYIRRELLETVETPDSYKHLGGYASFSNMNDITTHSNFGTYIKTTPTDTCQVAVKTGFLDSNKHTHCTYDANGNCTKSENTSIFAGSNYHKHGQCKYYTEETITQDNLQYNSSKKCLYGQTGTYARITFEGDDIYGVNMDEVSYIKMKLGTGKGGSTGKIYFKNTTDTSQYNGYLEERTLRYNTYADGSENCEYLINVKENKLWTGTLAGLMIECTEAVGESIYLYSLELITEDNTTKKPQIYVDNQKYQTKDYGEIRSDPTNEKGEVYIAPTEEGGLYKLLHIVYNWNRNTNVLMLDTPDGTTFQFTIGSDKALVNGKSVDLEKPVELYDGAPVIPLFFVLEKAGYYYSYNFTDRIINITVANSFEFDEQIENGDAEGTDTTEFYSGASSYSITVAPDPDDSDNNVWLLTPANAYVWNYIRTKFEWVAGKTYTIDFDARRTGKLGDGSDHPEDSSTLVFNARYADTAGTNGVEHNPYELRSIITDEWKHFTISYTVAETLDTTADPSTHELTFYVDPYNNIGVGYMMDNIVVRETPIPFKVVNGNAESEEITFKTSNSKNTIERVTENGNSYWKSTCGDTSGRSWNYLVHIPTISYEKGVTYYYRVKAKIGQNAGGSDTTTNISLNARYADMAKLGADGEWFAHTTYLAKKDGSTISFTTGEDWQQCYGSFTISQGYVPIDEFVTPSGVSRPVEEITFFANPDASYGVTFMIDDFEVTTDPAVYEAW